MYIGAMWLIVTLVVVVAQLCTAQVPYPPSAGKPTTLFVFQDSDFDVPTQPDAILLLQSLQGLVSAAGGAEQIYRVVAGGGQPASVLWLDDVVRFHGVRAISTNITALMDRFASKHAKGYVLCDFPHVNAGISMAAALEGVVCTEATQLLAESAGLQQLVDVRTWSDEQCFDKISGMISKEIVLHQDPTLNGQFLTDWALKVKAYASFAGVGSTLWNKVVNNMAGQGKSGLLGWGTDEFQLVSAASKAGVGVNAADYASNLAVLSNFQPARLYSRSMHTFSKSITPKHTVSFLMSDGDNIQWMVNAFAVDPKWYGSPKRGKFPVGWTISGAMPFLYPTLWEYIQRNATAMDGFVVAPSGWAYVYPDLMTSTAVTNIASGLGPAMASNGWRSVNVLGAADQPVLDSLAPLLARKEVESVLYFGFADYASMHGAIQWQNDKPVIGARWRLWGGFNTPQQLAAKINNMPADPTSSDGYSLISVNVWSMSVDDIEACIHLLEDHVEVVLPDELVQRVKENVDH